MDFKLISVAGGAFGLGALVAWAFTADYYEQKLGERLEIADARIDILRNKMQTLESEVILGRIQSENAENPRGDEESEADVTGEEGEDEGEFDEEETEAIRTNLQGIIDHYTASPEDRDEFVRAGTAMEVDNKPPYVISRDEYAFGEEGAEYEKTTLQYFPQHRILLDDAEEPIGDVPAVVGWQNLRQFGGESLEPDTVFIRNRRLLTDFEVVKDDEGTLPEHVEYGMGKEEFATAKAAGVLRLRDRG